MKRGRSITVLAAAAALIGSGCFEERARYDVPRLKIAINDTIVEAGKLFSVHLIAADQSGIIYLAIEARSKRDPAQFATSLDDIFRKQDTVYISQIPSLSLISADSLERDISLRISDIAVPGSWVIVKAVTLDNQNFQVTALDSVRVKSGTAR
jgi:hypothetical protein